MTVVFDTGHKTSRRITRAIQEGLRCPRFTDRNMLNYIDPIIIYGILRKNDDIWRRAMAAGCDVYLVDNGYLRPGHFHGYYRITKNSFQHSGYGRLDYKRWKALGLQIKPWRLDGDYILIPAPPPDYNKAWRFDGDAWLRTVKSKIHGRTSREIIITYKPELDPRCPPDQKPFGELLKDAWAVITHDSGCALDALLAGVPVFTTGVTPAARCGAGDLKDIERPRYCDDREEMFAVIAGQQWTLAEMERGLPWKTL